MDSPAAGSEVDRLREWLETASTWRAASLLFALPGAAVRDELLNLAQSFDKTLGEVPRRVAGTPLEDWGAEYHRILGPGGCAAIESSYEENALAGRGPLLAGIAGYYEAFGYRPENPGSETPDHISIEAGFLSYLALKIAFAEQAGRTEEAAITRDAYESFRNDHPGHWLPRFAEQLVPFGSSLYDSAAGWLAALLSGPAPTERPRQG